jgi:tyrosine-protein phosphatase non-receptor type 1
MGTSSHRLNVPLKPFLTYFRKNELRRRRLEKKDRMDAQVREMKRRQKESEDWQKLKRSLFSPLSLGLGAAIVGGSVLAYFNMRG